MSTEADEPTQHRPLFFPSSLPFLLFSLWTKLSSKSWSPHWRKSDVESFYTRSRSRPGVRGLSRGRGPLAFVTDVVNPLLRHAAHSGNGHAVYYPYNHHHDNYWWLPCSPRQELQVSLHEWCQTTLMSTWAFGFVVYRWVCLCY